MLLEFLNWLCGILSFTVPLNKHKWHFLISGRHQFAEQVVDKPEEFSRLLKLRIFQVASSFLQLQLLGWQTCNTNRILNILITLC